VNFWNKEAYEIAYKITGGRDIYRDLVAFTYILLHDKGIAPISLPATFARYAYQQYNWKSSAFNKQYASYNLDISEINIEKAQEEYSENRYGNLLDEYFDEKSATDEEFFCKEIAKLVFQSMSYREIRDLTGISTRTIYSSIKQFGHDFRDFCSRRSGESLGNDKPMV
jgi:hypothetical protein